MEARCCRTKTGEKSRPRRGSATARRASVTPGSMQNAVLFHGESRLAQGWTGEVDSSFSDGRATLPKCPQGPVPGPRHPRIRRRDRAAGARALGWMLEALATSGARLHRWRTTTPHGAPRPRLIEPTAPAGGGSPRRAGDRSWRPPQPTSMPPPAWPRSGSISVWRRSPSHQFGEDLLSSVKLVAQHSEGMAAQVDAQCRRPGPWRKPSGRWPRRPRPSRASPVRPGCWRSTPRSRRLEPARRAQGFAVVAHEVKQLSAEVARRHQHPTDRGPVAPPHVDPSTTVTARDRGEADRRGHPGPGRDGRRDVRGDRERQHHHRRRGRRHPPADHPERRSGSAAAPSPHRRRPTRPRSCTSNTGEAPWPS